jgi:hypothetical protein
MRSQCARRVARHLWLNHGEQALDVASAWTTHFVRRGDEEGAVLWSEILLMVHLIREQQRPPGTTLH